MIASFKLHFLWKNTNKKGKLLYLITIQQFP